MLYLKMASLAFYFVLSNVFLMDEEGIFVTIKVILLEMTVHAVFKRHCPVAYYHLAVTLLAGDVMLDGKGMVVTHQLLGSLNRCVVAVGAVGRGFRVLSLEMAEKTGAGGDSDMLPLNDLGMAAGAAEFLTPAKFGQMGSVVEQYFLLELDLALQQTLIVAASPETAFIGNLRPGLGPPVTMSRIFNQLLQTLDLALERGKYPRRVVADNAGHITVRRKLPGPVKRLHVMAGVAEFRARSEFHRSEDE